MNVHRLRSPSLPNTAVMFVLISCAVLVRIVCVMNSTESCVHSYAFSKCQRFINKKSDYVDILCIFKGNMRWTLLLSAFLVLQSTWVVTCTTHFIRY